MNRQQLPISALPAWSKLNAVQFLDIKVQELGSKGFGLVTERELATLEDTFDIPTLMIIPHDLILSAEAIEEHAKVDQHFQQLLHVAGGKSLRGDILLRLLMEITRASPGGKSIGVSNPWTEYVKMLPSHIPVPTMWNEEERVLLAGTSLEAAVNAKMAALLREFETLREETATIPWCEKSWWQDETLDFRDWIHVDALWRSRSLELPQAAESMVPCLDMVNHSVSANAYYEQKSEGVSLLLRPNVKLDANSEVSISYGNYKTEAEMLFSYGFIDDQSAVIGLTLDVEPFPDDPLGKAKAAAFTGQPVIRISQAGDELEWNSPFLYFMCLNEEDGLDFRVLQQTDGSRSQLRVFWQETDVTEVTNTFETLIATHQLAEVFKLRTLALLQDRVRQQIEQLYESEGIVQSVIDLGLAAPDRLNSAFQLRKSETAILEKTFASLDVEKNKLLSSEVVLRYLGSMDGDEPPEEDATNEDDASEDFS